MCPVSLKLSGLAQPSLGGGDAQEGNASSSTSFEAAAVVVVVVFVLTGDTIAGTFLGTLLSTPQYYLICIYL